MGEDTCLFSTSGTDVCTAFVGGVPTLPVYQGELQARALGAKVEAFDEEGNSLVDEIGGLVVTERLPSIPVFLSGDDDGGRYVVAVLRPLAGRLAPRRQDHVTADRRYLRPLGRDDQPPPCRRSLRPSIRAGGAAPPVREPAD